jgi:hypothetical protein
MEKEKMMKLTVLMRAEALAIAVIQAVSEAGKRDA